MLHRYKLLLAAGIVALSSFIILKPNKRPTLWLIGDSTVRNGTCGCGDGGLWGWGAYLQNSLDSNKVIVQNKVMGGTSSRSFWTGGLWEKVRPFIQPGDIVLIQFGHNDGTPSTLRGTGDDSAQVTNPRTKKTEWVHSFGWNIRKYIRETKAKGGIPIVITLVPRDMWKDGKVDRVAQEYVGWDKEVAAQEKVDVIDLNKIIADHYDELGQEKVMSTFFTEKDHTHTILAGAQYSAKCVIEGLKGLKHNPVKKAII